MKNHNLSVWTDRVDMAKQFYEKLYGSILTDQSLAAAQIFTTRTNSIFQLTQ